MRPHKLSSMPTYAKFQPTAQSIRQLILNTTHESVMSKQRPKTQRLLFGILIGSAPFLIILVSWMFLSLCVKYLARFYHRRKRRALYEIRNSRSASILSDTNI